MGKTARLQARRRFSLASIVVSIAVVLGSAVAVQPASAASLYADVVVTNPSIVPVGGYAVRLSFDYKLNTERADGGPSRGYVALLIDEERSFYSVDVTGKGHFSQVLTFASAPGTYNVLYAPSLDGGPASENGMVTGPYYFGTGTVTLPVALPVIVLATPKITGTAAVGNALTVAATSTTPNVQFTYRWMRNGAAISAATLAKYTVTAADLGSAISVNVTASKTGYTTVVKTSAKTPAVTTGSFVAGAPTITGTTRVGNTLTANPGTWAPAPASLSYQWSRGGVAITGATAKTHAVTAGDLGKVITVTVRATKTGYSTGTKTSAATVKVTAAFTQAPAPLISGTVKVGQTLTAKPGTWVPVPATISYQWKRAGVAIPGATTPSYLVRPTDADASLTVTVTGAKTSYTTLVKPSAATIKVVGLAYSTCALLNAKYPHGVAKAGVAYDKVKGVNRALKGPPYVSTAVYSLNTTRDGDKDGIACEG